MHASGFWIFLHMGAKVLKILDTYKMFIISPDSLRCALFCLTYIMTNQIKYMCFALFFIFCALCCF